MTLHLNKKHVSFQVKRSLEVLKTIFVVTTKENSRAELKQTFWNVLNVVLESLYFAEATKAVFLSIRYHKTSQTQDVKSQSTKRSLRELAQPKRDSAFEQKTRIVPSREVSGSSQKSFVVTTKRNSRAELKQTLWNVLNTSFWKVGVFPSVKSPKNFRKLCTKIIKTIAHNTKRRRPLFQKNQKLFL